jgi:aspartyl-tRNA synthetase
MDWKLRRYCGDLSVKNIGETVQLSGWIDTIRDHGQVLFMHLRDVTGFVQIVFDPAVNKDIHALGEKLHNEYVVTITATILEREDAAKNHSIESGHIELRVDTIDIHSASKTPPFVLTEKSQVNEESSDFHVDEDLRLKFRYLDLRRPSMQKKLLMRYRILKRIRDFLDKQRFTEVETPILTKSTPEGARDYLVPSRVHHGHFYALPQSPQLFKQLLMVGGMDRYFQIVKCFRDEDLRPNRQPEFTQLDLEASFIDESFIYSLMENLMEELFSIVGKTIKGPFPHMTYDTAMNSYGSDKPDLRFDMKMIEVTPLLGNVNFQIFKTLATTGGCIKAINVKGKAADMSKNMLQEELAKKVVPKFGGKGMAWMKMVDGALQSNIVQFFSEEEQKNIIETLKAENGDVLLFIADMKKNNVNEVLGRLRLYVAENFGFIKAQDIAPIWVTDFPLFEEKDGHITSIHHPFTAPKGDVLGATTREDILAINSRGYDLVINGEEVGGGSIRIHQSDSQHKIFSLLGLDEKEIESKFGWFVQALQYGTPPHGGIALGIDRLVGMLLDTDNIREVIAFPKNRMAYCPLTQAPSGVDTEQLDDLHICVQEKPEEKA